MNLAIYDNSDFDRGAPRWKEAFWRVTKALFFQNAFPWPDALRIELLRLFGAKVGRGCTMRANVNVSFPWRLTLGDYVWVGEDVAFLTLAAITVGSHVCISQRAYLCTGSHDVRRNDFKLKVAPITIADGVWVAAAAFIGPGVVINRGAVVAAGAVVFRDVAENTVVRGNPAEVERTLTLDERRQVAAVAPDQTG